mmetsp:Transcript_17188/g.22322  ORF Transcript_17188/g.22322 Transcript_17188/m.22322 type:complete len:223 (-) Transcript_17188:794-1462(-)
MLFFFFFFLEDNSGVSPLLFGSEMTPSMSSFRFFAIFSCTFDDSFTLEAFFLSFLVDFLSDRVILPSPELSFELSLVILFFTSAFLSDLSIVSFASLNLLEFFFTADIRLQSTLVAESLVESFLLDPFFSAVVSCVGASASFSVVDFVLTLLSMTTFCCVVSFSSPFLDFFNARSKGLLLLFVLILSSCSTSFLLFFRFLEVSPLTSFTRPTNSANSSALFI